MKYEKADDYQKFIRSDLELLEILIRDNSSNKNIVWASDHYLKYSVSYKPTANIEVESLFHSKSIVRARILKNKKEQQLRLKNNAEVFTSSWICNTQNNLIDGVWFGKNDVFNYEKHNGWDTNHNRIEFSHSKSWIDYVNDIRLEVACGEAPYLVSRYDSVTGNSIDINNRIGILDRKIRVINENVQNESDWLDKVLQAYQSTYGFDWQGDNVYIARENLVISFMEYYNNRFHKLPEKVDVYRIAEIVSWNIWQMDGLKYVIPNSCKTDITVKTNLFGEVIKTGKKCYSCEKEDYLNHNGIYSKIMIWNEEKIIRFVDLMIKAGMK